MPLEFIDLNTPPIVAVNYDNRKAMGKEKWHKTKFEKLIKYILYICAYIYIYIYIYIININCVCHVQKCQYIYNIYNIYIYISYIYVYIYITKNKTFIS